MGQVLEMLNVESIFHMDMPRKSNCYKSWSPHEQSLPTVHTRQDLMYTYSRSDLEDTPGLKLIVFQPTITVCFPDNRLLNRGTLGDASTSGSVTPRGRLRMTRVNRALTPGIMSG